MRFVASLRLTKEVLFWYAFLASPFAVAADLNGLWLYKEDGSTIQIIQQGNQVKGVLHKIPAKLRDQFGFSEGDESFYGTLDGDTLQIKSLMHFAIGAKNRCPDQWTQWIDKTLKLSGDGNTLQGEWAEININTKSCQVISTGRQRTTTLIRQTDSPASFAWGTGEQQFGLQQGEEIETLGAHTFTEDADGNRYIADPVNKRIKILNSQGRYLRNIPLDTFPADLLRVGDELLLLDEQGLALVDEHGNLRRYELSPEIPKLEGYGQGLWAGLDDSVYVCKAQECYPVIDKSSGTRRVLPPQQQFDGVMPGYPLKDGTWVRAEWLNPKQARIVFFSPDEVLREVPLQTVDSFGALTFLGQDRQSRLYFEIERITPDQVVHLDLQAHDETGKLLSTKEFPNDYFSTVYKKLSINRETGQVRQLYSTPEGIRYQTSPPIVEAGTASPSRTGSASQGKKIDRYIAYPDGTALDTVTGLMWMRCLVGQTWDGKTCNGIAGHYTWDEAMKQKTTFAGYSDWRLPTIEELRTLIYCSSGKPEVFRTGITNTKCCEGSFDTPTIIQSVFLNNAHSLNDDSWLSSSLWSASTAKADDPREPEAWTVMFDGGCDTPDHRYEALRVKLVRKAH